ncbi:uncharacterized protein BN724_01161 [Clostridium sp. CAG:590]|nr:uncharacterized protein BN724_01161 [Clostridium sp. CAG:590]
MARKSIEDVMNEIEDFLNSCKTTALSSNKVIVPRDEFDELFGDLKVKIPAEIDRCKKIMRNKEAILMDARKNADGIIAEATQRANQMVSETEIMNQANQKAYETVEMARVQANDILAQAVAEANEVRLGSMQYTNDIMMGIRNYVEATMEAERANYENLIAALNNDFVIANANIAEVQNQIVEFTGDPSSVTRAPQIKTAANGKAVPTPPKAKQSVVDKVKQAVGVKEEKIEEPKQETKPAVNIPDFITSGEKVVPNETPLQPNVDVKPQVEVKAEVKPETPVVSNEQAATAEAPVQSQAKEPQVIDQSKQQQAPQPTAPTNGTPTKKVKKKIVKKRNPVLHTPQTAQETVAKTLEAAAAAKVDKTVYKANGEQAREVPPMEGRVKRGPRVGRGLVENQVEMQEDNGFEVETDAFREDSTAPAKSLGVVDDFSMEEKF